MIDFKKEYKACMDDIHASVELKKRLAAASKVPQKHIFSKKLTGSAAALAAALIAVSGLFLLKAPFNDGSKALNAKTALNLPDEKSEKKQNSTLDVEKSAEGAADKIEEGEKNNNATIIDKNEKADFDFAESGKSGKSGKESGKSGKSEKKVKKIPQNNQSTANTAAENSVLAKNNTKESKSVKEEKTADTQKAVETVESANVTEAEESKAKNYNDEISLFSGGIAAAADESDSAKAYSGGGASSRTVSSKGFTADFGFGKNTKEISFEEYLKSSVGLSIKSEFVPVFEKCLSEYDKDKVTNSGAELYFEDFSGFVSTKEFSVFKNGKKINLTLNDIQGLDGAFFKYENKNGFYVFLYSETLSQSEFDSLDIFE